MNLGNSISMKSRFFLIEFNFLYSEDKLNRLLFTCRNFLYFSTDKIDHYKHTSKSFIIVDFGTEVEFESVISLFRQAFDYSFLSCCWLSQDELSTAIDFCLLFSNYNYITKGNFLQQFINERYF